MKKIKRSEQILQKNFFERNKTEILLFLSLFLTYGYFFQGGGWNQNARFDQTRSIVEKGTFIINDYVSNTGDWTKFKEHFYPNKPPGCSFLGTPVYFVVYWIEKLFRKNPAERFLLNFNAWLTTIFSVGFLSALLGVILFKYLKIAFPNNLGFNLLVTIGYSLGTLAFPYSTIFHAHQLSAFFLFAGFYYFLFTSKGRQKHVLIAGILSGTAILMEYQNAVVVLLMPLLFFLRREKKCLLWYIGGLILPVLSLGVYHYICFGSPFSTGRAFQNPLWLGEAETFHGFVFPNFKILPQITFLPFRGLFFGSPWLILAIPGFVYFLKQRNFRRQAFFFLCVVCFYFLLNLSFYTWEAGWTCGPRYLISMLPFMAGPVVFIANRLPKLTGSLIAISVFFMLASTATRPEIHPSIKNPLSQYILPHFVQGELSLNPQGIDEIFPGTKYPLDSLEAKTNSFNLGEVLHLSGLTSLVPLLLIWIILYLQLPKERTKTSFDIQKKRNK